jgi:tight adherence protein B
MDPVALLTAGAAGAAALLLVWGVFGGRRAEAIRRLDPYGPGGQQAAPSTAQATAQRASIGELVSASAPLSALNRAMEQRSWSEELAREMARADLALRPVEYITLRVGVIVAAVAIDWVLGAVIFPPLSHPLALAIAGIIGFFVPLIWIGRRKGKRVNAFNAGLADTITLIANALRSGSSFLQSIEMAVRESQPPISTEFNRVIREVSFGLSLEQALANMLRRVHSDDLELLTTAVTIQYQVGGNLAEILDTIAFTIRERVRIKGEIRTLTAQQRLSGYIVGFLPIGLVVLLAVIAPKFMNPMFANPPGMFGIPVGVILLLLGATSMIFGFLIIRRIVDIEV